MKSTQRIPFFTKPAFVIGLLPLGEMSLAQITGFHSIQSLIEGSQFVEAVGPNTGIHLIFGSSASQVSGQWNFEDSGNGQVTISNSGAGYATFDYNPPDSIEVFTSTSAPTLWTVTKDTTAGNNLYTISAPLNASVPNSDWVWWTIHDATSTLYADLTDDPADSGSLRLWRIV